MHKMHRLADLGQAIWLDYIRRSFITSGQLRELVDQGLRGVTSNPSIFEKAIAGSADYDDELRALTQEDRSVGEIYEALVVEDIQRAADVLRPVHDRTAGLDGYVSLEVDPTLAHDTAGTIAEARRLFTAVGRPNVLIKVPATPAGIPAIRTLIGEGININVTLIFALSHYEVVAEAYLAGLEDLAAGGGDLSRVASVASFFVSRVDTAVDHALEERDVEDLQGTIAVANAKVAYARFRQILAGERWEGLAARGARAQRVLWASTSTKNPAYPDTLYVDSLIGPDTVNTLPPATLQAFLDHGRVASTIAEGVDQAHAQLARLAMLGVDLDQVTETLQKEGVASFARSFETLMASIAEKREKLQQHWRSITLRPGAHRSTVDASLAELQAQRVIQRIWTHDHTLWASRPTEISNRLGWLHVIDLMKANVEDLQSFVAQVRADGYNAALLLGMGGSSLAPEVFRNTFGVREGYLDLDVLDSTDPCAVWVHSERLDLRRALFVVSTKSGGTVETLSFFKFFYNEVVAAVGAEEAGAHFVAITDPGSGLVDLAREYNFRHTFLADSNIGGRYSALSHFGLVPAALVGVDLVALLERAHTMVCNCEGCEIPATGGNAGALLGTVLGALANAGRDKLTLVSSPAIANFGDWVEQLVAESTGKEGKGILPVVGEPLGKPDVYGADRLFVHLRLRGDDAQDTALRALIEAGHPMVRLNLDDLYDLGGQFFLWEMATAVASHFLGINPFDQPNVEAAKVLAREMVSEYTENGALPQDQAESSTGDTLAGFLAQARPGDYIALQAYVEPTPEVDAALAALRLRLRDRYRLATTVGYGPRFLHSTGQLHKGDAGNGLFIQLTAEDSRDVPIPDEAGVSGSSITFGTLKMAQALGDKRALLDAGRRVIRLHLGEDVSSALQCLAEGLT